MSRRPRPDDGARRAREWIDSAVTPITALGVFVVGVFKGLVPREMIVPAVLAMLGLGYMRLRELRREPDDAFDDEGGDPPRRVGRRDVVDPEDRRWGDPDRDDDRYGDVVGVEETDRRKSRNPSDGDSPLRRVAFGDRYRDWRHHLDDRVVGLPLVS